MSIAPATSTAWAWLFACCFATACSPILAQPASAADVLADPRFAADFKLQYGQLANSSSEVLAEELRDALEDIMSRNSAVSTTSVAPKARQFEHDVLRGIQDRICGSDVSKKGDTRRLPTVTVEAITAVGQQRGLRLGKRDIANVAAIAVHLTERSEPARFCRSVNFRELAQ